ncbi:MAG: glycosyltransferase, partial [Clostridia bacterium]|nr:glycosyltransferase [Clostridia bacterium]
MKISVCIPMYNEEKVVKDTLDTLTSYMEATFNNDYELILINDGSKDSSADIVKNYRNDRVKLIDYEKNMGKGYAVRQGVLRANGDIIMFTDCDLAYGCDVIKRFYEEMKKSGAHVAVGSRNLDKDGYSGYSPLRKFISRAYIRVLCIIGGLSLSDSQCGCKAFSREMGKRIFSKCEINRFAFDFEAILIADALGVGIGEYPVKIVNHRASTVRIFHDSVEMLRA